MPLDISIKGLRHQIDIDEGVPAQANGFVRVNGQGARLRIGRMEKCAYLALQLGGGAEVSIGEGCSIGNLQITALKRGKVRIGVGCGFNGVVRLLLHEPSGIEIGDRCLFGGGTDLATSDMHSILDVETGRRLNPAQDIVLAPHVWLGERVLVLKGARIGRDTVVGAASVVTGDLPANAVCAGSPARVLRTGTTWRFELI